MNILDISYWINTFGESNINTYNLKEYISFIKDNMISDYTDDYTEKHHIIPKCININKEPDSNNIAVLLARDHFTSHKILVDCFTNKKYRLKLVYAFNMMTKISKANSNRIIVDEESYEEVRKLISESQRGENNPMFGKHASQLCKDTASKNITIYNRSEKKRKRTSEANRLRVWSNESREKLSKSSSGENNYWYGKQLSEKHKAKMSKSRIDGKWINNGVDNKFVHDDKLEEFLSNGWTYGLLKNNKKDAIRKTSKIIVCGIDGAGKDTLIKKIIKENPDKNFEVIHCTRHTPNNYEFFRELLTSERNIIFNRAFYGQFVYQTSEERKSKGWLSVDQLIDLERIIKEYGFKVVYVRSSIKNCLYNCNKDSEDSYYTEDYLIYLETLFSGLFFNISTLDSNNFELYNNDYEIGKDSQSVSEKDFDYSSLPKVVAVDFDNCLVYGKKFPIIGDINYALVHDLFEGYFKDYKKILFTHRTGQALIDACNFCADNGIYFDAVNDDIPEVKEALGRTGTPENGRKPWFDILLDDKCINPWESKEYNINFDKGIYRIVNKINGKCYVGKSEVSIEARLKKHFKLLREDNHRNKNGERSKLQKAFNKYGEENFYTEVICNCPKLLCCYKEIYYIEKFDSYYNGYNQTLGGDGMSGMKWVTNGTDSILTYKPEEYIELGYIYGRYESEETRIKKSNSHTGMHNTDEQNRKISESNKRRKDKYNWMNNGEYEKLILKEEVNIYLNIGYTYGRLRKAKD